MGEALMAGGVVSQVRFEEMWRSVLGLLELRFWPASEKNARSARKAFAQTRGILLARRGCYCHNLVFQPEAGQIRPPLDQGTPRLDGTH
jgi:hypothetical protein